MHGVLHLKYQLGYKEKVSSAAFRGTIAHAMIQQAYAGIPLSEAHERVWRQQCPEIAQNLVVWCRLDSAYQASGNPRTKARQLWLEQHPQYPELTQEIEAYKDEFLSEDYTWAKSALLTEVYRWSAQLATCDPSRLLLPSPLLVEGLSVVDEHGQRIERFRHAQQGSQDPDVYCMLYGEINGMPVVGVPDVFTMDAGGVAWVADYKTMDHPMRTEDLAEDEQLALYVVLLLQNGYILPGQKVHVGHIYLRDAIVDPDGIVPVWTTSSPSALPRLAQQLAYMDRHVQEEDVIPIRGIATGTRAPCVSCGLAQVCPTSLASPAVPLPEEVVYDVNDTHDFH